MTVAEKSVALVPQQRGLVTKFAQKFSIEPEKLMGILKATAFKQKDGEVTNEQMAALLVVADQYGLNPFTREIFAFPDKQNGIVPVVGVDGWSRIVNDHAQSDGFYFKEAEEHVTMPDAKPCPAWMEVVIFRKDRANPTIVREYLDEVYRPLGTYADGNKHKPGPWQTHTKRFLRHKVFIQGARIAYGFSGIYDEDEASRIIEGTPVEPLVEPKRGAAGLKSHLVGDTQQHAAQAKSKPVGTLELRDQIIASLAGCKSTEALALAMDAAREHEWTKPDLDTIEARYQDRMRELEAQ